MFNLCQCGCGQECRRRFVKGHHCRGKHPSMESKEKNRQAHLGKPAWNKGKTGIYTEETLLKIKEARARQIMQPGWHHSLEAKEKNRLAHLGKTQTEISNRKRSESLTGKLKSEEHRKNISISKSGENNPGWQGGISNLPYSQDWTDDLRDAIRKRDGYQCQICHVDQEELNTLLDVHHIDYNKENCDPANLISLCKSCHIKTNRERERWTFYFKLTEKQEEKENGRQSCYLIG